MSATQDAEDAAAQAHRAVVEYDADNPHADRLIRSAQAEATAAIAVAIDRLAEAVESLKR